MVIIASILVAFGLDASWANYQDAKVERRLLAELHDELESAKVRISSSIVELETVIEATSELVEFLGKDPAALSSETTKTLIIRVLNLNTLEVPTSVLESIIASGQVRLISNSEVRDALAEWPAFIFDVRENHEWHRVETDEFLIPYLAEFLSIRDAIIISDGLKLTPGTFDYDVTAMQRDPVFEGRLVWRMSRQRATLDESKVLLDKTDRLLTLIAAEISRPARPSE